MTGEMIAYCRRHGLAMCFEHLGGCGETICDVVCGPNLAPHEIFNRCFFCVRLQDEAEEAGYIAHGTIGSDDPFEGGRR